MAALQTLAQLENLAKSKGIDPSFEGRKKKFEELGLTQSLGDFRGSGIQNQKLFDTLSAPTSTVAPSIAPVAPTISPAQSILDEAQNASDIRSPVNPQFQNVIPPKAEPSFQDILSAVRGQTTTQLEEESARLAKEAATTKAESDKAKVRQTAAERGVAFSPAFFQQPQQAIDAEKVAKDLGVDIGIAKIIARGMETELTQRAAKTEAEQKAQATFLEKTQGAVVDPATGEQVTTLATTRAEEAAVARTAAAARAQATQDRILANEVRGLDKEQRKIMSDYLGEIPNYTSREEALVELNKFKTKIVNDIGEAGLTKLTQEIDRQFPAPVAAAIAPTAPLSPIAPTAPLSPIEKEIEQLKRGGILHDSDIRNSLGRKYSQKDIAASSIGSIQQKVGRVVDSISNFLFK